MAKVTAKQRMEKALEQAVEVAEKACNLDASSPHAQAAVKAATDAEKAKSAAAAEKAAQAATAALEALEAEQQAATPDTPPSILAGAKPSTRNAIAYRATAKGLEVHERDKAAAEAGTMPMDTVGCKRRGAGLSIREAIRHAIIAAACYDSTQNAVPMGEYVVNTVSAFTGTKKASYFNHDDCRQLVQLGYIEQVEPEATQG